MESCEVIDPQSFESDSFAYTDSDLHLVLA